MQFLTVEHLEQLLEAEIEYNKEQSSLREMPLEEKWYHLGAVGTLRNLIILAKDRPEIFLPVEKG